MTRKCRYFSFPRNAGSHSIDTCKQRIQGRQSKQQPPSRGCTSGRTGPKPALWMKVSGRSLPPMLCYSLLGDGPVSSELEWPASCLRRPFWFAFAEGSFPCPSTLLSFVSANSFTTFSSVCVFFGRGDQTLNRRSSICEKQDGMEKPIVSNLNADRYFRAGSQRLISLSLCSPSTAPSSEPRNTRQHRPIVSKRSQQKTAGERKGGLSKRRTRGSCPSS